MDLSLKEEHNVEEVAALMNGSIHEEEQLAEEDDKITNLIRKLTLKRIGLRQGHAISAIKQRKSGYEAFNMNRKNWSNVRNQPNLGLGGKDEISQVLTTSLILQNNNNISRKFEQSTDTLNLYHSQVPFAG